MSSLLGSSRSRPIVAHAAARRKAALARRAAAAHNHREGGAMTTIQTATGPVDSAAIGFTLMHEHIFVLSEGVIPNFPHLWDREARKAQAVKQALEGPVTPDCPASILRTRSNVRLYLDSESASMLAGLF